jgi:hypothetical protein
MLASLAAPSRRSRAPSESSGHPQRVRGGQRSPRGWGTTLSEMRIAARLTGAVLAALAVLHLAWGVGSAFPFRSRRDLADAVVGSSRVPPPTACIAVAAALATGTALVVNVIPLPPPVRRASLVGMAAIFGARSALGFSGKTALVSPGSDSERFIRLDQRIYAPICLGLSVGSVVSMGRPCTDS